MFMKFTIDVVFIDKHNKIIRLETLKPFKISKYVWKAKAVMNLQNNRAKPLNKGDVFSC